MIPEEEVKTEMSGNEKKIIEQIEYYFGDINIHRDKFMKYQLKTNDNWFPLDVLMTFNKLKSMTQDKNEIINAIKKSNSNLIELSECQTKIHRIKPMPKFSDEFFKQLNQRTLHLKGFPKDCQLEQIQEFCKQYGEIESVEMRRRDGNFKGCIMVVFKQLSDAEKVLENKDLKFNELELLKENKEKYWERKQAYLNSIKNKKKQNLIKTEGAILKITNVAPNTKFIDIKNELTKHSKVAFVTAINEDGQCFVRFDKKDGAKEALKALKKDLNEDETKIEVELCGQQVTVELVKGEEEIQYWKEFNMKQQQHLSNRKNKWQKNKRRHDNNKQDDGGDQDDQEEQDDSTNHKNKKMKIEETKSTAEEEESNKNENTDAAVAE